MCIFTSRAIFVVFAPGPPLGDFHPRDPLWGGKDPYIKLWGYIGLYLSWLQTLGVIGLFWDILGSIIDRPTGKPDWYTYSSRAMPCVCRLWTTKKRCSFVNYCNYFVYCPPVVFWHILYCISCFIFSEENAIFKTCRSLLPQRWPHGAPYVWAAWKFSRVPSTPPGYFCQNF